MKNYAFWNGHDILWRVQIVKLLDDGQELLPLQGQAQEDSRVHSLFCDLRNTPDMVIMPMRDDDTAYSMGWNSQAVQVRQGDRSTSFSLKTGVDDEPFAISYMQQNTFSDTRPKN